MSVDAAARLNAALEGRYRIERPLGEGGMALVYLAEDVKHKRRVALKVLRPELAAILGAERFLKEIEVTAHLQHPNILPLYDSGEADTFLYYVMPLMEGETLREKLDRERQLPVEQTVDIARSVAAALDYAHRHGVVHRDIKPSNILLHDGQALVADFGIALAMRNAGGGTRLTETGLSIGTPHYMSPEQAAGDRELDARSDLYSLGAVTYEMLVGEPPHVAKSAQAVVAKILSETPTPIRRTRELIPVNVEAAVTKALARSPADRFPSAADFASALTNPGFTVVGLAGAGSDVGTAPGRLQRLAPALAASTAVALALAAWGWVRPEPSPAVARYALGFEAGQELSDIVPTTFAVSEGGAAIVYRSPGPDGVPRLLVKWRDRADAVPLAATGNVQNPYISPDTREVAFYTVGNRLSKVALQGGAPITLSDSAYNAGVAWLDDGSLLFGLRRVVDGSAQQPRIARMSAAGGEARVVGPSDLPDSMAVFYPVALPGSGGALVTVASSPDNGSVWALDLESGEGHEVIPGGLQAWYLNSGHVAYIRPDGAVFAVPFHVGRMEVTGAAVPLLEGVQIQGGWPDMSLASDGTLLYTRGGVVAPSGFDIQEVVWVSREGLIQTVDPGWSMQNARNFGWALSPDGTRLAIGLAGPEGNDIWIKELDDGPLFRLTYDPTEDARPRWSRDGRSVYFLSRRRQQVSEMYVQRADGAGDPVPVLVGKGRALWDTDETPDGAWIVARTGGTQNQTGARDIVAWHVEGSDTTEVPLLTTDYDEVAPKLSPDGRWLAYASQESGEWQVNVRPFPDVGSGRWVVSRGPAVSPLWSPSGRELFYLGYDEDGRYTMMAAAVDAAGGFRVTDRTALFPIPDGVAVTPLSTGYDVSPDGRRFLMVRARLGASAEEQPQPRVILVENWLEEVKARVAGR